jgi:hypothetical protein
MQSDNTWLSISLFCSRHNWNALLRDGIKPFLDVLFTTWGHSNYLLEFNDAGGDNIRFSPQVPAALAEPAARLADEHFKAFFSEAGFEESTIQLPLTEFFLPFQQNSIQYGLYKPFDADDLTGAETLSFQAGLSQIIMEALQEEEEADEETIITLALYLAVALMHCMIQKGYASEKAFLEFYHNSYNRHKAFTDADLIDSDFEETKAMLIEIVNMVVDSRKGNDGSVPWLGKWLNICTAELDRKQAVMVPGIIDQAKSRLFLLLYKHLGITEKNGLLLAFYIRQILSFNVFDAA